MDHTTGYANVNGLHMYHEVTGAGPPMLAMAGGKMSPETFSDDIELLSKSFTVLAPEQMNPTLVIAGDRDAVTLDHTLALFRGIPNAQLCIVPNEGHGALPKETLLNFLTAPAAWRDWSSRAAVSRPCARSGAAPTCDLEFQSSAQLVNVSSRPATQAMSSAAWAGSEVGWVRCEKNRRTTQSSAASRAAWSMSRG